MPEPRTLLPDARVTPRFAGLPTFCRFPQICHVPPASQPVDWAIYGVPYDGAVTYRPGARFGPRAVRDASQYVKPYHLTHDLDITAVLSMADGGDAPVAPYSCEHTTERSTAYAMKLGKPGHTRLLAVGGDHSIALANLRATWRLHGAPPGGLALIHFDSHLDTVDTIWGERYTHGSVFRRAIEERLVDPRRMLSIGVKGPLNRREDLEFARDHGVTLITYDDWRSGPGGARIARAARALGGSPAYLTFDVDVVDPAFAPGTGTPSVGGFTSAEALSLLRTFAGANVVGADVVEVLPDRDQAGITSLLAAHVVFEILAIDAVRVSREAAGRPGRRATGQKGIGRPAGVGPRRRPTPRKR